MVDLLATIRDAIVDEAAVLEALQRRSSDVWEHSREALAAHADAIELPQRFIDSGWVRVALNGSGKPIGFSVVIPGEDRACELDGLFVDPDQLRRGIGRALVADASLRRRIGRRWLEVTAGPAKGFYERVGFHQFDAAQTRFGPAVRMRLELGVQMNRHD